MMQTSKFHFRTPIVQGVMVIFFYFSVNFYWTYERGPVIIDKKRYLLCLLGFIKTIVKSSLSQFIPWAFDSLAQWSIWHNKITPFKYFWRKKKHFSDYSISHVAVMHRRAKYSQRDI